MNSKPIRCLITAGSTREHFDLVRYVSNPSTGKMGYALAQAASDVGWKVDLVSGPVTLPTPPNVKKIDVVTAQEMFQAVSSRFDFCDLLIMTAAVCDFRPKKYVSQKIRKEDLSLTAEFELTVDILSALSERRNRQNSGNSSKGLSRFSTFPKPLLVGFAAQTDDNIRSYALKKLKKKGLDWICANRIDGPNGAFGSNENTLEVVSTQSDAFTLGPLPKTEIATFLINHFVSLLSH